MREMPRGELRVHSRRIELQVVQLADGEPQQSASGLRVVLHQLLERGARAREVTRVPLDLGTREQRVELAGIRPQRDLGVGASLVVAPRLLEEEREQTVALGMVRLR